MFYYLDRCIRLVKSWQWTIFVWICMRDKLLHSWVIMELAKLPQCEYYLDNKALLTSTIKEGIIFCSTKVSNHIGGSLGWAIIVALLVAYHHLASPGVQYQALWRSVYQHLRCEIPQHLPIHTWVKWNNGSKVPFSKSTTSNV